jgi:hypothetical protein
MSSKLISGLLAVQRHGHDEELRPVHVLPRILHQQQTQLGVLKLDVLVCTTVSANRTAKKRDSDSLSL